MKAPFAFDRDHLRRAVVVTVVALVAVSLAGPVSAQSAANATPVDSCTTIDKPGHYVLTRDITGSSVGEEAACIEITASNVVFDGGGHTLSGNGSGHGIEVNGTAGSVSNVTVERLHAEDWSIGVFFLAAENGTIRNTVTNDSTEGIALAASSGNRIVDNTAYDNAIGIAIGGESHNNTVRDALAVENKWGIHFERKSGGNTVTNSVARNNSNWDYYSMQNDRSNTVTELELSTATLSFTERNVALRAVSSPPPIPNGTGNLDSFVRIYDTAGTSSLSLTIDYSPTTANAVSLWRTTGTDWSRVRGATATSAHSMSVENTTQFGTFAVLADAGSGGPVNVTTSQPPSMERTLTTTRPAAMQSAGSTPATPTPTTASGSNTTAAADTDSRSSATTDAGMTTRSATPTPASNSPSTANPNGTASTVTGGVGGKSNVVGLFSNIGGARLLFAALGIVVLIGLGLVVLRRRDRRGPGGRL